MNDSKDEKELLEQLIIAILNKFLGKDFVIVRSAAYDAIENKIDIVLLERKSGNIVSAFIEVESDRLKALQKQEKILERNLKGGGNLKYGMIIEENKAVIKGHIENIPVFYLNLSEDVLKKGLKELLPSLKEKSDYEKSLFDYFISSFNSQVAYLKLESSLNSTLEEKILHFGENLDNYSK